MTNATTTEEDMSDMLTNTTVTEDMSDMYKNTTIPEDHMSHAFMYKY